MERTVEQFYLEAVEGIAAEHTALHGVLKALLNRGDEFLRNVTASHLVHELQAAFLEVFVYGTYVHDDIGKLTATTRLLLVDLAEVDSLRDGFLIVNLRLTLVTFNLELALQTVDNDIEVQLTHTRDNGLTALLVGTYGKGGVFFGELGKTVGELV